MNKFGLRSASHLNTCHPDLIKLFKEVIKKVDCSVLEGHRHEERQDYLYNKGKSTVKFPNSRHNVEPSEAADVVPYPIDWEDIDRFRDFVELVKETAEELGIEIEAGGDWKSFVDYPHFQLKRI